MKTPNLDKAIQSLVDYVEAKETTVFKDSIEALNLLKECQRIKGTLVAWERVKEELEITNEALDQAVYRAVKAEKELEAYKKHIFNSASDKTGSNI